MTDNGQAVSRKIWIRLITPLMLLLVLNSLDRVNISFGALHMNAEIGLSPKAYGLGVGLFFVGYILFQGPSTQLLKWLGPRRWLFAIVFTWGCIATATAFVQGPWSFYVLRVLLGFAEAGFAPGVVYLCTQWMPPRHRAAAVATVMLAIPVSVIIGGPLSGWLMSIANPLGLAGWRWMYLVEGAPTVLLAFLCLRRFVDSPAEVKWLTAEEKAWLADESAKETASAARAPQAMGQLLVSWRVWAAAGAWFTFLAGAYGLIFWLPQVIKQFAGGTPLQIGLLTALPWIGVGAGMALNAWHSDRTQERFLHVAGAGALAAVALLLAVGAPSGGVALLFLTLGGIGLGGAHGAFWTVPPTFLGPMTAIGGIAVINMIGNLSGVVTPYVIGLIRESTGSFSMPIYFLSALLAAGAVLTIALRLGHLKPEGN